MTPIHKVLNIGPKSAQWLEAVGIQTEADLEALGAVEAYRRVKAAFPVAQFVVGVTRRTVGFAVE